MRTDDSGLAYNVYCDESCHLEHDRQPIMVLGAVWCPRGKVREANVRIAELKRKHGLSTGFECKWTKVSESKEGFYLDMVDYFFDDDDLHFRALIAPKGLLRHDRFDQDHDGWYYKMYFSMLKNILSPEARYFIYLDLKDSRGARKISKLHEILSNNMYDFSRSVIQNVQQVRSHEVGLLQLTDLLIGVISYANRQLSLNKGKTRLVERVRKRSGLSLTRTTLMRASKVNLFKWQPAEFDSE